MTPAQVAIMSPQHWEAPVYLLGQRVRQIATGNKGFVQGHWAWNPPVVTYGVKFDDESLEPNWFSASDLEPVACT